MQHRGKVSETSVHFMHHYCNRSLNWDQKIEAMKTQDLSMCVDIK